MTSAARCVRRAGTSRVPAALGLPPRARWRAGVVGAAARIPGGPGEDLPAAHTEDHPLAHIDFEGTIAEGSYGVGEVTVWDHDTCVCEAFEDGKVVVELHGDRLRGRDAPYRTRDDCRIHRMDPPDSGRAPMREARCADARTARRPAERQRLIRRRGQVGRDPRARLLAAGPALGRDPQPRRRHQPLARAARPRPAVGARSAVLDALPCSRAAR